MKHGILRTLLILIIVAEAAYSPIAIAGDSEFSADKMRIANSFPDDNMSNPAKGNINGTNIFLSLLLPGLGQWSAGYKTRAKTFAVAELALWASYFGSREYAISIKHDYFAFAALHAGVDTRGKDDQYWIDIGNAQNIYLFNERRLRERNLEAAYDETEENFWQWDKEQNRVEYTELREKQDDWKRIASFMIGGMVLNRIVSAVDVVRLIRKDRKSADQQQQSFMYWDYHQDRFQGEVVRLNLTVKF